MKPIPETSRNQIHQRDIANKQKPKILSSTLSTFLNSFLKGF